MKSAIKLIIRFYQRAISPQLGPACRYEPSCSHYAYEAVDRHGALRGSWMAVRRLGRCHPGREGGFDPVPDRGEESRSLPDGESKAS